MDLRRKQVIRAGIPRLEETAVTALLRRPDGSVCGVFALNVITGEYQVVLGRAVILATGYSDRLHARSTGTREMSGDGIAMAWRAGATLANLEMQWWHTNDIADPPTWQRMQVYPNPMLGSEKSARMVNSAGEEFFNQQQDDPLAYGPYTVQLKALAKQVHAGKARYEGGYYAGFDNCDAREVEAYTSYGKSFRQLGLAFPEDMVEAAVTAHYRQGGIDVDTGDHAVVGAGPLRRGRAWRPQQRADRARHLRRQAGGGWRRGGPAAARTRRAARSRRAAGSAAPRCIACHAARWRAGFAGQEHHPRDDVGEGRRREGRGEPQVGACRTSRTSGSTCCRA